MLGYVKKNLSQVQMEIHAMSNRFCFHFRRVDRSCSVKEQLIKTYQRLKLLSLYKIKIIRWTLGEKRKLDYNNELKLFVKSEDRKFLKKLWCCVGGEV